VAARVNAPVIGAEAGYAGPGDWSLGFSWRTQKSDRHFVGSNEQEHRAAEGSEVINDMNFFELALTRTYSDRFSLTFGIPYIIGERSQALRDPSQPDNEFGNDPVVDRTTTQSRGLGDVTIVPHWWVFKPQTHVNGNLSLGLGIKIPTGENSVEDTFQVRVDDPNITTEPFRETNVVRAVDQSIQPGDGGFGAVMDLQAFYRFGNGKGAGYVTGTYLSNPENISQSPTYRGNDAALSDPNGNAPNGTEAFMSVADQYLYRIGGTWFPTGKLGLSLGGRWEGVPVHDLVGGSDGFRRPGYAFSIEPGLSYTTGPNTFAVSVPVAAHRNRLQSAPDKQADPPREGDAAFADYIVIFSYFHRFEGKQKPPPAPAETPAPSGTATPAKNTTTTTKCR